jgi:phosphoglycerate kinase
MSGTEVASAKTRIRRLAELHATDLAGRIACLRMDGISLQSGRELADFKVRCVLPSLEMLASAQARTVLLTHVDHTESSSDELQGQQVICRQLAFLSGRPVRLIDQHSEMGIREAVIDLREGEALMLGHLASEPAEKENRPDFARFLAGLCDIYCVEAFSQAHEVSASTVSAPAIARAAVAGVEFQRIFETLSAVLDDPSRPLLAVLGGGLSLDKLLLLERIAGRADVVLIGGEVALAFQKAEGMPIGAASVSDVAAEAAGHILSLVRDSKTKLLTPEDYVTANAGSAGRDISEILFSEDADSLNPDHLVVDIGNRTRHIWSEQLPPSRTILWHAPVSMCEFVPYSAGTLFFADEIARRTSPALHKTIICGESLTGFLLGRGFPPGSVNCFSPAGTSILHYAAGYPLPAIEALKRSALKPGRTPVVLLALVGDDEDARLAEFAGGWFPETSSIHCIYVEPGPDQDRTPDLYSASTGAERLGETWRVESIFGRTDAALASFGITPASRAHVHGDPSERLVRRAGEVDADVIVLDGDSRTSTRYRRSKVVDASPCHVLLLPSAT